MPSTSMHKVIQGLRKLLIETISLGDRPVERGEGNTPVLELGDIAV